MNSGLLLKENSTRTLWIPRYDQSQRHDECKDHRVRTFEVGLICRETMMKVGYQGKRIHYLAVNWVLLRIADPLEQRCFPGIRPPDNEYTEVGVLGSDFRGFFHVSHHRC